MSSLFIFKDMVQLFFIILHPEVAYVGLVTLLYAGTTSNLSGKSSFKYSINGLGLNDIVKKLKQRSKSAGNILLYSKSISNGTSETLRNEIVSNSENIIAISVHN